PDWIRPEGCRRRSTRNASKQAACRESRIFRRSFDVQGHPLYSVPFWKGWLGSLKCPSTDSEWNLEVNSANSGAASIQRVTVSVNAGGIELSGNPRDRAISSVGVLELEYVSTQLAEVRLQPAVNSLGARRWQSSVPAN